MRRRKIGEQVFRFRGVGPFSLQLFHQLQLAGIPVFL
jgi:hypothetical protein